MVDPPTRLIRSHLRHRVSSHHGGAFLTEYVTPSEAHGEGPEPSSNILLVEDNEAHADVLIEALSTLDRTLRVRHVPRLSAALSHIAEGRVDAVVLDLTLPDASGLDGLTRLRSEAPDVPVLVLTGSRDDRLCAEALRGGAQDYLVKGDLDAPGVARKIRDAARRQRYMTQALVRTEEQARFAAAEEQRALWLAAAGSRLGSSLDQAQTMQNIRLALVPDFADECRIEMVSAHPEQRGVEHLEEVVRSGRAYFDESTSALLIVPLTIGSRCIGAIVLSLSASRRRFSLSDRRLGEELAHRAAFALENARLHEELRAAVAMREEFLSIASHELRSPIATALMQLQLLKRVSGSSPSAAEQDRRIDSARAQTVRVARLVDRLFDVSLISSGQLALKPEPLDLRELVQGTVDRFLAEQTAAVPLVVFEDGQAILGNFDRLRLEQVVTNLIANGVKYGLGKEVRLKLYSDDGVHAVLTVSDGGMGIPSSELDRIFGRFERGREARYKSGLGLGLYVSRQIVQAHGGTIVAASEPGKGSVFTVTIPIVSASERDEAESELRTNRK